MLCMAMMGSNHNVLCSSARPPQTKRPLMNHNLGGMSASSSPHYHSKSIGDYHMSRQNPDVLDQMYSSSEADVPDNHTQLFQGGTSYGATSANRAVLGRLNGHHSTVISPKLPGSGAPPQMSYLRHMLNSRRAQSASPSSLVQLAARGGSVGVRRRGGGGGRLLRNRLGGVGGSPATAKVAGVARTTGGEGEGREGHYVQQQPNGLDQQSQNPWDKEVVLSALRQRR